MSMDLENIEDGAGSLLKDVEGTSTEPTPEILSKKFGEVSINYKSKYYISRSYGGYSGCTIPGSADVDESGVWWPKPSYLPNGSVLPNCVGYATGRFNEGVSYTSSSEIMMCWGPNPGVYLTRYNNYPVYLSDGNWIRMKVEIPTLSTFTPKIGCLLVWTKGETDKGHVAIVEDIKGSTTTGPGAWKYKISESGWSGEWYKRAQDPNQLIVTSDWLSWNELKNKLGATHHLAGCVYNPFVTDDGYVITKGWNQNSVSSSSITYSVVTSSSNKGGATKEKYLKKVVESDKIFKLKYDKSVLQSIDTTEVELSDTRATSLLTYPTMVEAPFVSVKIGDYTFGTFSKYADKNFNKYIQFPNYVTDMTVNKVNGSVNTYTIHMTYQVEAGQDPNFIDKVLSSIGYGKIYLDYGDWMFPSYIYQQEEALITKVQSNVNFKTSSISYTISAQSTVAQNLGSTHNFQTPSGKGRPSEIIESLFDENDTYGLKQTFKGMASAINRNKLIPHDDKEVDISPKPNTDVLSWINYLVSCMSSNTNEDSSVLRDSSYYLTIHDDLDNDYGGSYFKITKVLAKQGTKVLSNENVYEVDIGYPTDTYVEDFKVNTDNSWALLYNYSMTSNNGIITNDYIYTYDNNGNLIRSYSPSVSTSSAKFKTTEAQRNWWTNMTQFPVKATLNIKGLLRPTLLMTNLRINAMMYGQRHTASGLYVITKQTDTISGSGYKTTLELQRIAGDNDYYTVQTVEEERRIVKVDYVLAERESTTTSSLYNDSSKYMYYYISGKNVTLYTENSWDAMQQLLAINPTINTRKITEENEYETITVDFNSPYFGYDLVTTRSFTGVAYVSEMSSATTMEYIYYLITYKGQKYWILSSQLTETTKDVYDVNTTNLDNTISSSSSYVDSKKGNSSKKSSAIEMLN